MPARTFRGIGFEIQLTHIRGQIRAGVVPALIDAQLSLRLRHPIFDLARPLNAPPLACGPHAHGRGT